MNRAILPGLLLLGAGLAVVSFPLPARVASPVERVIRIEADSFSYAPAVISVNPGDRVTLELVSTDVVHGLYVDGYGVSVESDPGQTARLTFTADRGGSFRFRCNVTCGAMHPFMIGKLNVGRNTVLYRSMGLALIAMAAVLWQPRKRVAP